MDNNKMSSSFNKEQRYNRILVSGWRRLGTHLVDTICFLILYIALIIVFFSAVLIFGYDEKNTLDSLEGFAGTVFILIIYLVYYIGFESLTGRTPGKYVLGTIVINRKGEKPSLGQCFWRTIARFIPFEPFSLIGNESYGWHDSLAKTYVVRVQTPSIVRAAHDLDDVDERPA